MPFEKGRAKTGGRVKGQSDKHTISAQKARQIIFEILQKKIDSGEFEEWIKKNASSFYTKMIIPLMPKEMKIEATVDFDPVDISQYFVKEKTKKEDE